MTYVIADLNGEVTIGTFYEKKLKKLNKAESRIQKVVKKKAKCYLWSGKVMIIRLIPG